MHKYNLHCFLWDSCRIKCKLLCKLGLHDYHLHQHVSYETFETKEVYYTLVEYKPKYTIYEKCNCCGKERNKWQ